MADEPEDGLTAEQTAAAIQWLSRHWKGANLCPICGGDEWEIGRNFATPILMSRHRALQLGGQVTPMVQVTSQPCGYTFYFSAVVAGLFPKAGDGK